jgi:hypothetical protein
MPSCRLGRAAWLKGRRARSPPQNAEAITGQDFWTYANASIRATYPNATEYEAAAGWVKNAT